MTVNIGHEALDSQLNYPVIAWEKTHGQKVSEAELDAIMAQRRINPYIPLGCDRQGRQDTGVRAMPVDACSDFGALEDQSDAADAEVVAWFKSVAWWLFKVCMVVCIAWSAAMLANGLLGWIARGGV
jgi:hypothetical protein